MSSPPAAKAQTPKILECFQYYNTISRGLCYNKDDCFDRLDQHSDSDVFAYECRRENDGGFMLHLTLHQPTQQPLDTLYTLRFDPGRQTIVTLIFIREAFGYKEPLFPQEMLDEFLRQKFDAHRTK